MILLLLLLYWNLSDNGKSQTNISVQVRDGQRVTGVPLGRWDGKSGEFQEGVLGSLEAIYGGCLSPGEHSLISERQQM